MFYIESDKSADPKEGGVTFTERSAENLEKYIEMVEGLQLEDASSGAEAREGAEERVRLEAEAVFSSIASESETLSNEYLGKPFSFDMEARFVENGQNRELIRTRARTPNRLKYEAEVEVIRKQIGDLEEIRAKLGLSRRKMCQLLMVDPSAWSRWAKEGAPPYVYRALEWYMLLSKEVPHHAHSYWLATVGARTYESSGDKSILNRLKNENLILEDKIKNMQAVLGAMGQEAGSMRKRSRQQTYATLFALLLGFGSVGLYIMSLLVR